MHEAASTKLTCITTSDKRVTGASAVSQGGKLQWPAGTYDYCGDRPGEQKWDVAGPVKVTYTQGQVRSVPQPHSRW